MVGGLSLHLKPHFECSGVVDNSFPHLEGVVWWSGLSLHLKPHFECSCVVDNSFPHLECVVWWVDLACI